ncbi:uncharacterized protein LOC114184968 [Vigna unguiculata]|uniref:uncharacterized protein LOC114184968 n=1 Tax=Vigna unguiculata TaxID=3917 RepID=UPI00101674DE|nr:uncharacterized protein LOC114184968 [Vigna unguiculata]
MDMKKRGSTIPLVMWILVIYHCVAAVSVMSMSNVTTSLCDGSLEDCLNVIHLDSQLPTISSSHFRRILAQADDPVTKNTPNPNNPAVRCSYPNGHYKKCGAQANPGGTDSHCPYTSYKRDCVNINPNPDS